MKKSDLFQIRTFIRQTAITAGSFAREVQLKTSVIRDAGAGDITTNADLDTQMIIVEAIQQKYQNIPIIAEEGNIVTQSGDECFIVDPIDGSGSYAAGAPDWSTTIAYRAQGIAEGVIYLPVSDRLYVTHEKDVRVCVESGKRSSVIPLQIRPPNKPPWRICCPITREFSEDVWQNVLLPLIRDRRVRAFENVSCNTVHFVRLFEGWDDAVIMWAKIWDAAAAIPMAKMLGITVTDFNGNEPDLSIIEPQRLVFARGQEVLNFIIERTKHWPLPENELRKGDIDDS